MFLKKWVLLLSEYDIFLNKTYAHEYEVLVWFKYRIIYVLGQSILIVCDTL